MRSGIYIVQLLNETPMPVTRDPRYVNVCAQVNKLNIKVGKAKDFEARRLNYLKDFDEHNVVFEPLVHLEDIKTAEKIVLKTLNQFRKKSPKGGKLEWLEGVSYESVRLLVLRALESEGLNVTINPSINMGAISTRTG